MMQDGAAVDAVKCVINVHDLEINDPLHYNRGQVTGSVLLLNPA